MLFYLKVVKNILLASQRLMVVRSRLYTFSARFCVEQTIHLRRLAICSLMFNPAFIQFDACPSSLSTGAPETTYFQEAVRSA
ncbi:MAG TPA: hypothetical protein VFW11_17340 [Cyclobacteriaceae bacterium]|nr:hypothetical protein [Cyclobacteriaceae bacterium]